MPPNDFLQLFQTPITESEFYIFYNLKLLCKAQPSHGTGDVHGNKSKGIDLISYAPKAQRQDLNSIFLYGYGNKNMQAFTGKLPLDLKFEMSREAVRLQLGTPDWSIEGGGKGILAATNLADKWLTKSGEGIRIEYSEDHKSIKHVSIASAKQEAQWRE